MACGCGGGAKANSNSPGGDTLGYRAILPNKSVVPPRNEPPFFMAADAMREVTLARGGTVRRIRKSDPTDDYAVAKREAELAAAATTA
ncbi:hypothetical protein SEA_DUCHESSDUNG_10 [Mycobacterium phage DuchessDung]|nr:hypothetical protein CL79_gp010 [Mycobacterium phage Oline]AKF12383.1 hypothetical protein PDRPv_10 [Mycobacterium phage PDRPv]AKF12488.1 hypothetical protein PDRPxv_11 [Mycobacterium phage PDRPxv]AOQ28572.1 hypothetical protein SEA_DERPP_10 [Mycobacterium phage Derpp]AOQ28673.1 hypothetical protein SEA_TYRIONL_10 [Mycobacterium phage TyrionL]AOQ28775.1 hypothetical protein SEA_CHARLIEGBROWN_10 [Mycobacterium phage CharlieGBrown]AOQ29267.1 hypothetical protein SEA_PINKMAN_10 [Mycobacterium